MQSADRAQSPAKDMLYWRLYHTCAYVGLILAMACRAVHQQKISSLSSQPQYLNESSIEGLLNFLKPDKNASIQGEAPMGSSTQPNTANFQPLIYPRASVQIAPISSANSTPSTSNSGWIVANAVIRSWRNSQAKSPPGPT